MRSASTAAAVRSRSAHSLPLSKLMKETSPKIKSYLSSFEAPDYFPILSRSQTEKAFQSMHKRNLNRSQSQSQQRWSEAEGAAVLVPLLDIQSQGPSVLFTLRSSTVGTHANQISFPGGRIEREQDHGDAIAAAIRETAEELVPLEHDWEYDIPRHVQVLGRTSSLPSITGIPVTPIVGSLPHCFANEDMVSNRYFPGNPEEVERVFTVSVEELLNVETAEPLKRLGGRKGPVFDCGTERGKIWGLTAMILRPILHKILKPLFLDGSDLSSEGLT